MASKRNPTKPDTPDWNLSAPHRTAINLLVTGKNIQDTAAVVGVQRSTVSVWLHHHAGFQAELNTRRQELWQDIRERLWSLAPKALDVLEQALESEQPVAAAVHILKCLGVYGLPGVPRGPTDPRLLAAATQTREDEAQHAEEEAVLAARRKAHSRLSNNLHLDLTEFP